MAESNISLSVLVSLVMTLRRLKSAMSHNDDLSTGENLYVPARECALQVFFCNEEKWRKRHAGSRMPE